MYEIIIYGAGAQGRAARRILESQRLSVTAFADRDEVKVAAGEWEGIKVISPDTLHGIDKSAHIVIGMGASRIELLRQVDTMLQDYGFVNIFWSAVELIKKLVPDKKLVPNFYGLEICTNVGCTVQCKWCAQKLFVSKYTERIKNQSEGLPKDYMMSFTTFKACIDKAPENISIDFSGYSETFLNPAAVDMILYAYERGNGIILYTTLVGLSEMDIDRLSHVVFEHIMPHLPDIDGNAKIPITDEYLRVLVKFWKTFDYAFGDANNILAEGISYHGTLHPKIVETFAENDIDITKYKNFSEKQLPIAGNVCDTELYQSALQCGLINFVNTKFVNCDDMKFFKEKLQTMSVLFPNGDVTICNHDYGLTMVYGNLLEMDYYDLFDGNPAYEHLLAAQRDPNADILCRTCEFAFNRNNMQLITRATHLKNNRMI